MANDSETRTFGANEAAGEAGTSSAADRTFSAGGGSNFSQASVTTEGGKAIGLDDPHFWAKMLPERPDFAKSADANAAQKAAERAMRAIEKTAPKDFDKATPAERPRPSTYQKAAPKPGPPPGVRKAKRDPNPPFSLAEAEAVERLLLAYGHRRAPQQKG